MITPQTIIILLGSQSGMKQTMSPVSLCSCYYRSQCVAWWWWL